MMKPSEIIFMALVCAGSTAIAQNKPAYLDPGLPAEQRAADLVKRMTPDEKASQLVNQARHSKTRNSCL
jgi:beta-glucosidase